MVKKDRERLTVYVDSEILERFKADADKMYRSMSDHMNAILASHYKTEGNQDGHATTEEKRKS